MISDDQFNLITEKILGCCFDVMNELGGGFLESVYRNALRVTLLQSGLKVDSEKKYEISFRGEKIGFYFADLVVEDKVIVELKCCDSLVGEHQAQLINYLKASGIYVGLLINFGKQKIVFKRLHHPHYFPAYTHTPKKPQLV